MRARERAEANARGRAPDDPAVLRRVAALLAERWDPAAEFPAPDGTRAPASHATAIIAIYAAGGSKAEVLGYLRRAEEAALGQARSDGHLRGPLATAILDIVLADPYADVPLTPARAIEAQWAGGINPAVVRSPFAHPPIEEARHEEEGST